MKYLNELFDTDIDMKYTQSIVIPDMLNRIQYSFVLKD